MIVFYSMETETSFFHSLIAFIKSKLSHQPATFRLFFMILICIQFYIVIK